MNIPIHPPVTVSVQPHRSPGPIKPMHAVNNVPVYPYDTDRNNLFVKMQEAGIPYFRTHDTAGRYGGAHYVDVENLFPCFDADENDPASYDFAFTDRLFEEAVKYGMKPFFRLGATIENFHFIKAYHIFPPRDFGKWARICEHIIRHYNEGWADGYRFGIEYWEIWNEPDNMPDIADNPMWKGTIEEFCLFYDTVSTYLKGQFPDLKIGGYGSCGFYAISDADYSETAHSSSRVGYFIDFLNQFLTYISSHGQVLDFFSWHSYAAITENARYAAYARNKLNEYGFTHSEIFLNEWNPCIELIGTAHDASNIASAFCIMQKTPTDMCMYYDAQINTRYCGLFNFYTHDVFRGYYAFYAFNRLYRLGHEMESSSDGTSVYALAARDSEPDGRKALLMVNNRPEEVTVRVDGFPLNNAVGHAVDEDHWYDEIPVPGQTLTLPAFGFVLLETTNGAN